MCSLLVKNLVMLIMQYAFMHYNYAFSYLVTLSAF